MVNPSTYTKDTVFPQKLPRPSGSGYVRYEDLYRPGDNLRSVVAKVPAAKVLTLPSGEFLVPDFDDPKGSHEGLHFPTSIAGLVGSGQDTVIRVARNGATRDYDPPVGTAPMNVHFAGTQFRVSKVPGFKLGNLTVGSYEQGNRFFGGFTLVSCPDAEVFNVWFKAANRGYSNSPPGETFGLNVYKSDRVTLRDCDIDGREERGYRVSSSGFGWNGSANNDRSGFVSNAKVLRTRVHHGSAGMPTFWKTSGIYTEDLISYSYGTGSGGKSGSALNHEQCVGKIEHVRPQLYVNGPHAGTDDKTANTGLNFGLNSGLWDPKQGDVFIMRDYRWDPSNGAAAITMSARNGYQLGQGVTLANQDSVQLYRNGRRMAWRHHPASGWQHADPATEAIWVH